MAEPRRRDQVVQRPSIARGGGAGMLRAGGIVVYVISWSWLVLGMTAAGSWLMASVLTTVLIVIWRIPPAAGCTRFETLAGAAAIAGGLTWAAAPLIGVIDPSPAARTWPWLAAALFLLPSILAVRQRESRSAEWLGFVGWALGFMPIIVGGSLAAGVMGPISGDLAYLFVSLGTVLLLASTVPFAVVAAWARVISIPLAGLLVVGSVLQFAAANAVALQPLPLAGAVAFGAGWLLLGAGLLQPLSSDRATDLVGTP